jgi:hypothetical protein
LLFD